MRLPRGGMHQRDCRSCSTNHEPSTTKLYAFGGRLSIAFRAAIDHGQERFAAVLAVLAQHQTVRITHQTVVNNPGYSFSGRTQMLRKRTAEP